MLVKLSNNFTCVLRSEEGRLYSQTMDYVGIYLVGIFFLKGQVGHVKYKWKYDDGEFEKWQAVATLQFKSSKTWDILPYFNFDPVCGIITVLPSRPCFVLLLILSFSSSLILCCSSFSWRRSFVEIIVLLSLGYGYNVTNPDILGTLFFSTRLDLPSTESVRSLNETAFVFRSPERDPYARVWVAKCSNPKYPDPCLWCIHSQPPLIAVAHARSNFLLTFLLKTVKNSNREMRWLSCMLQIIPP